MSGIFPNPLEAVRDEKNGSMDEVPNGRTHWVGLLRAVLPKE